MSSSCPTFNCSDRTSSGSSLSDCSVSECSSSECSLHTNTLCSIGKICSTLTSPSTTDCYSDTSDSRYDCRKSSYGCDEFTSMIIPVSELYGDYTGCRGAVQFRIRRRNKTVNLQWEPFHGIIGASGTPFLTATQTICNLPPYTIKDPIVFNYKGIEYNSFIEISPHNRYGNIKFHLPPSLCPDSINMGDSFDIPAKCISWIVEH